jgi:tight adherence protein C
MRVRRRQIAEEKAAKTAVQLIFPLVLFIFPAIFVVLVGPAAIQIQRGLFKG